MRTGTGEGQLRIGTGGVQSSDFKLSLPPLIPPTFIRIFYPNITTPLAYGGIHNFSHWLMVKPKF